jgi:hypothetical protein
MSLLLNSPWILLGMMCAIISVPKKFIISKNPKAIIVSVKSFWWYAWIPGMKGVRAMAIGNVVLLGEHILDRDLEHELVHVTQFEREPFIHPFLYTYQNFVYGYRENKYEKEAYHKAGNAYVSRM